MKLTLSLIEKPLFHSTWIPCAAELTTGNENVTPISLGFAPGILELPLLEEINFTS